MSTPAPQGRHRGTPADRPRSARRYVGTHSAARRRRPVLRHGLLTATLAVTGTAAAVTGGLVARDGLAPLSGGPARAQVAVAPDLVAASLDVAELERRGQGPVSRSASGGDDAQPKQAEKKQAKKKEQARPSADRPTDPRGIARAMLPEFGFSADQFGCLDALYVSESNWNMHADNPTSSAYGIPQALTETHDMPAGYFTSAEVQIRWGLGYIRDAYGSPCAAWDFKQGNGWY